ncbi:MAG: response regulator [Chloroflexi bacterium]|nr:response regulator [Chloroflexota bacterium]MCI0645194.1 response regulator [Chloroflexota bacterium]MCI0730887.1 response regulator [Chloroflexota bacterium]
MTISLQEAYILVVEDEPNAKLVTLDLLRMGGADHCFSRTSVDAAIQFAEKLPRVDLFLVDINMPVHSGYDLLRMVRQHPSLNRAKVVAVTAGTLDEDIRRARELGFDGFLGKPLRAGAFVDQVQRILNGEPVWDWH